MREKEEYLFKGRKCERKRENCVIEQLKANDTHGDEKRHFFMAIYR